MLGQVNLLTTSLLTDQLGASRLSVYSSHQLHRSNYTNSGQYLVCPPYGGWSASVFSALKWVVRLSTNYSASVTPSYFFLSTLLPLNPATTPGHYAQLLHLASTRGFYTRLLHPATTPGYYTRLLHLSSPSLLLVIINDERLGLFFLLGYLHHLS